MALKRAPKQHLPMGAPSPEYKVGSTVARLRQCKDCGHTMFRFRFGTEEFGCPESVHLGRPCYAKAFRALVINSDDLYLACPRWHDPAKPTAILKSRGVTIPRSTGDFSHDNMYLICANCGCVHTYREVAHGKNGTRRILPE